VEKFPNPRHQFGLTSISGKINWIYKSSARAPPIPVDIVEALHMWRSRQRSSWDRIVLPQRTTSSFTSAHQEVIIVSYHSLILGLPHREKCFFQALHFCVAQRWYQSIKIGFVLLFWWWIYEIDRFSTRLIGSVKLEDTWMIWFWLSVRLVKIWIEIDNRISVLLNENIHEPDAN
jgi:hypothetical protein